MDRFGPVARHRVGIAPASAAHRARRLRAALEIHEVAEWRAEAEALEAELVRCHRCLVCGRALIDEVSIRRRIGPECLRLVR